ncbi:MAG: helix-turn-helix domain-containing protein [Blautia sp.]|jgi:AraC-like DNA-binding protein
MTVTARPHDKSGYLNQPFRLFHLHDQVDRTFDFHYHDFYKVIFFLSGKVTYHIEGKAYHLAPGDILLVNRFDIHKPEIDPLVPYERYILWAKEEACTYAAPYQCDLFTCFQKASSRSYRLIRLERERQTAFLQLARSLEIALSSQEFGAGPLSLALFIQLMISLNRVFLDKQYIRDRHSYTYDPGIEDLMRYINQNLTADLSADTLARQCYLSKYHLMRKFKEETGCTLHQYVQNKRLFLARSLIHQGTPVTKASQECGFHDYTAFSRAYKKLFHCTPSQKASSSLEAVTLE